MISANKKDNGYIITIFPEDKEERDLLERILNVSTLKKKRQEEYDYWTINPKKKEIKQLTFDDFVKIDNDECPFIEEDVDIAL